MGDPLSRIEARSGDQGQTIIADGTKVDKDSPPIEMLGIIDELNAWIGVLVAVSTSQQVRDVFTLVQHDLFDLSAQIGAPGTPLLSEAYLSRIESTLEQMKPGLAPPNAFILPGGAPSSAFGHLARAVCRRAERQLFHLTEIEQTAEGLCRRNADAGPQRNFGLSYLNRLSDLLLVASRLENRAGGQVDVCWERGKSLNSAVAT
jgi:cob(I)alamin adenosyltransferase